MRKLMKSEFTHRYYRARIARICFGIFATCLTAGSMGSGCPGGGVLSVAPFAQISAVQLFDQPNYTMALSVTSAVSNPGAVTKINWVFGDGGGFVEGTAGSTSISHLYASPGSYQVTAFIFGSTGFIDQINGSVTVIDNAGGSPGGGGGGTVNPPGKSAGFNPADGATDVPVKSVLKWTGGSGAVSHNVYLDIDEAAVTAANNTTANIFRGNQSTLSFDPGVLTENTTYFWRIDEVNSGGTTASDVISFKTARAPLKATAPVPANGSVSARVDQVLHWTAGLRATTHDVYFGTVQADVDAATKDTADIFKGNQSGVLFDPEDVNALLSGQLLPATTYFWRIDEVGSGGTTKGDIWSFTTQALPSAITNPSPADMATNVAANAQFSWDGVSSIESYDVYFGTAAVDVSAASRTSPEFKANQTTKTFDPGAMLPNFTYFWRVDTLGAGGTAHGATLQFTTSVLPAIVVAPFSPADNAVNVQVMTNLTWTAGVGGTVTSYDVYLDTNQSNVTTLAAAALKVNLPVGTLLFNPSTDLTANTNYFWRIVSVGPGGKANGPVLTFRTGILALVATNPVPANNAVGIAQNATLSWTAGQDAASHDVYFGTDQNTVTNATDSDASFKGNQAGVNFNPGALNANQDYFWRIDEVASGGKTKGTIWKFTTGPGKALTPSPTDGAQDAEFSFNLSWASGVGASSQNVYLGTDLNAVTNANESTPGIFRGNQAGTTYDPPETPDGNTTYFWRIDSVTASATTKGDVWSFKTLVGQAFNPIPTDNSVDQDLNVDVQWTGGPASGTYDVYFGTSLAAVTNATTASGEFKGNQPSTAYDPGLLLANTFYFWRIDDVAADMTKRKGLVWRFKTLAPPAQASNPNPGNNATGVAFGSPTLTWSPVASATGYDVFLDTVNPPVTQVSNNQPGTSFLTGALSNNTVYFWRVSPRNAAGTTTGVVWSFTTAP